MIKLIMLSSRNKKQHSLTKSQGHTTTRVGKITATACSLLHDARLHQSVCFISFGAFVLNITLIYQKIILPKPISSQQKCVSQTSTPPPYISKRLKLVVRQAYDITKNTNTFQLPAAYPVLQTALPHLSVRSSSPSSCAVPSDTGPVSR